MYLNFRVLIFCLLLSLPILVMGQGTGNSPFSQFGLGDLGNNNGDVRNIGMGSAGVSTRQHYHVNLANPALLPNKRTPKTARPNHSYKYWDYYRNLTIDSTVKLDFSINYQRRSIQSSGGNESSGGMNIAYFAFALPLTKTWATSIGIQPYSTVNYNLTSSVPVGGSTTTNVENSNTGKGGVYKIFWSHGVGITQNLSVGLESAVLYGNINSEDLSTISTFSTKGYGFKRQNSYSALSFKPGIHFRREIIKVYHDTIPVLDSITGANAGYKLVRKTKSSGLFYNIGLTYDFYTDMTVNRKLNLYVLDVTNRIYTDTTIASNRYKVKMPPSFRLGVSLDMPLKWTLSADIFYGAWSVYKPSFTTDTLANSYGFNIGGEYSFNHLKVKSKTYRLGFSYVKTPVIYKGHQLDDISVSAGTTIAFGRRSPTTPVIPRINVAVVAGQRGNVNDVTLKEQYIKLYFGILINEKWFNKRKIY